MFCTTTTFEVSCLTHDGLKACQPPNQRTKTKRWRWRNECWCSALNNINKSPGPKAKRMEDVEIESTTYRMQSGRSTNWAKPPSTYSSDSMQYYFKCIRLYSDTRSNAFCFYISMSSSSWSETLQSSQRSARDCQKPLWQERITAESVDDEPNPHFDW